MMQDANADRQQAANDYVESLKNSLRGSSGRYHINDHTRGQKRLPDDYSIDETAQFNPSAHASMNGMSNQKYVLKQVHYQ